MANLRWTLSVFASRWRNRLHYMSRAPFVYRNWWAILLPKLGLSIVIELRNGIKYLVRGRTTDLAVVNEATMGEQYLVAEFGSLPEDATVMDVGANIGDFTMQLARVCPRGRVFAVEPVAANSRMIEFQKLLNDAAHVTNLHLALGDRDGEIEIHSAGSHSSTFWGEGRRRRFG